MACGRVARGSGRKEEVWLHVARLRFFCRRAKCQVPVHELLTLLAEPPATLSRSTTATICSMFIPVLSHACSTAFSVCMQLLMKLPKMEKTRITYSWYGDLVPGKGPFSN